VVSLVLMTTAGVAWSDPELPKSDETDQARRSARVEAMRARAESLAVRIGAAGDAKSTSAELVANPLLHYSDLAGNAAAGNTADGTIWAWGKVGRPPFLAGIFYDTPKAGIEKWSCELLSLADGPISVAGKPGWEWKPAKSDIEWQAVPDAPPAAESPVQRLRQMKDIARRFTASQTIGPTRTDQLRLMDRPLHRYADAARGLIDGSLYAFAVGTNPEVLLILECRAATEGKPAWHCGFARMTSARCEARLDDKEFWKQEAVDKWNPREPYYSEFGPDARVFGTSPAK